MKTDSSRWTDEILEQYGLRGKQVQLIRHNENMTFCVEEKYLLRIHKSIDGLVLGDFSMDHDPKEMRQNELKILQYLGENGLDVQSPILNDNGNLVSFTKEGIPATLLTWMPGRIIEKEDITDDLCYEIGGMIGKLHELLAGFPKVARFFYDEQACMRLEQRLSYLAEKCAIDAESGEYMSKALTVIAEEFFQNKEAHILTHTDFSLSNILITRNGLVPIDFSLCGYAHPMMDLAGIYCNINGIAHRQKVAEGYEQAGGVIDLHALDCCFALNILLFIVSRAEMCQQEEWFTKRLVRWCKETFEPLGKGKILFDENFRLVNVP